MNITDMRETFRRLPADLLNDVLARDAIMRQIEAAPKSKRTRLCRKVAKQFPGRRGYSASRLRVQFYEWKRAGGADGGVLALVDHARCHSCGLPGCTQGREARLPQEAVDHWLSLAIENKKSAMREAWRVMMRDFRDGARIAGHTWMSLHVSLFPAESVPGVCPWSEVNPPPGWSLSNFRARHKAGIVFRAARDGMSRVASELPQVRLDFTTLRPLEAVVFDDHRLDFHVYVTDRNGYTQTVELWGLFAMDVATRSVIHFGLRPRLKREDGTTEGLTRRDMQHLIAAILSEYGAPKGYPMTLIVENAAAAVSEDTERLITHHTRGQVVIRRTGVRCNDVVLTGFPERWGNPRGKSWLESWFNPLDIVLGRVRGQTGSNYTKAPAEYEACLSAAKKMEALLTMMSDAEREAFHAPLLWAGQAHKVVAQAISILNERTDHQCIGFESIPLFRWSAADPTPKPALLSACTSGPMRAEVEAFLALPAAARDVLVNQYGGWRRESPAAKMRRLYNAADFERLNPVTFADFMLDARRAQYVGGNTIEVTIKRGRNEERALFSGAVDGLAIGDVVEVRFDEDRLGAGAWLMSLDREGRPLRVLGHMEHQARPGMFGPDDAAALRKRLGQVAMAQSQITAAARKITLPAIRQRLEVAEENLQISKSLALPTPESVAAPARASGRLVRAITGAKKSERKSAAAQALEDMELMDS